MNSNDDRALNDAIRMLLECIEAEPVPPRVLALAHELRRCIEEHHSVSVEGAGKPARKNGRRDQ